MKSYAKVKEKANWFAVRIEGLVCTFAIGENGTRELFLRRRDAVAFARELRIHIKSRCKVVRVCVTITEV